MHISPNDWVILSAGYEFLMYGEYLIPLLFSRYTIQEVKLVTSHVCKDTSNLHIVPALSLAAALLKQAYPCDICAVDLFL